MEKDGKTEVQRSSQRQGILVEGRTKMDNEGSEANYWTHGGRNAASPSLQWNKSKDP